MASSPRTYLILGGSGSGKSEFAQELAERCGEPVIYLATGAAEGAEMAWRIRKHQASRPQTWQTVEARRSLGSALDALDTTGGTVLLEDVGSLVGNCLPWIEEHDGELGDPHGAIEAAKRNLTQELEDVFAWCTARNASLIAVSSEVGLGLLPSSPVGRLYKDVIGDANHALAERADGVYLVVAGLPLDLRASAAAVRQTLGLDRTL